MDPPYDSMFAGVLSFKTLAATEETITKLENMRQRFHAISDKKGVELCRHLASLGLRRAELISRNRRVKPENRLRKLESALWFRIWLETPELFPDWLVLRKKSEGYRKLQETQTAS